MKHTPLSRNTNNASDVVVGHVGVDSGRLMIVDPCYAGIVLQQIDETTSTNQLVTSFGFGLGLSSNPIAGICFRAGYGDGIYPVTAHIVDGLIESLTIDFKLPD